MTTTRASSARALALRAKHVSKWSQPSRRQSSDSTDRIDHTPSRTIIGSSSRSPVVVVRAH